MMKKGCPHGRPFCFSGDNNPDGHDRFQIKVLTPIMGKYFIFSYEFRRQSVCGLVHRFFVIQ